MPKKGREAKYEERRDKESDVGFEMLDVTK
jgi:hypothetical protein